MGRTIASGAVEMGVAYRGRGVRVGVGREVEGPREERAHVAHAPPRLHLPQHWPL